MNQNYCGKTCEACAAREELSCPGCRDTAGQPMHRESCQITDCCVSKNHADCSTCTSVPNCHLLLGRDNVPEYRKEHAAQQAEQRRWLTKNAPEIGRWVWNIFMLLMIGLPINLMTADFIAEPFPAVAAIAGVAQSILSVIIAVCLLKLGKFKDGFRIAGWCGLATSAANLVMAWIESNVLIIVVGIPVIVVGLVATWHEYTAYSQLLMGLDDELSGKWGNLFKWEMGLLAGIFGCILLMLILTWVGLIALLADAIALLVVSILYYVYIYRTAKLFKEYTP